MASITIRNLDEQTKRQLRIRAAKNGRSMEEEARAVLRQSVAPIDTREDGSLWQTVRSVIEPLGGVELELPARDLPREAPGFGD